MKNTENKIEFSPLGSDLFGEPIKQETSSIIEQKYLVSPYTVISTREGKWQERKKAWVELGIKSEVGRDAAVIHCPTSSNKDGLEDADYTSIFDPALCELSYKWHTKEGMQIIDPFAGGSVRGVVASCMGREYWGSELRLKQVEANQQQVNDICKDKIPQYVAGDSLKNMDNAPEADFIFSCPPYGDLEKYSDDPDDLSGMEWHTFLAAYKRIILKSCKALKNNRFACFVVGDFRCKKGFYRNFVSETIAGFEACGVRLYNEAILVTPVGSASMRVSKQFDCSRKLAKTHQNILVFCKGDPKEATRAISE